MFNKDAKLKSNQVSCLIKSFFIYIFLKTKICVFTKLSSKIPFKSLNYTKSLILKRPVSNMIYPIKAIKKTLFEQHVQNVQTFECFLKSSFELINDSSQTFEKDASGLIDGLFSGVSKLYEMEF
ncbi:hypothetical protein BpHYR1_019146 [Brachionus plicatilis]|uniref:Uncharacterized protein n=1 Tax=Brachionus plicatilis TaxID=10195 RepID=A0A3M7PTC1_BRAPC|nr:hypothetical protein BpHYR1_019146 [Brachionus plicatilis]